MIYPLFIFMDEVSAGKKIAVNVNLVRSIEPDQTESKPESSRIVFTDGTAIRVTGTVINVTDKIRLWLKRVEG